MKKGVKNTQNISLHDLLTADYYDETLRIRDNIYAKSYSLIPDLQSFFGKDGVFANPEPNGLIEIDDLGKTQISIDDLLSILDNSEESQLVFIEGFAGCGKSTLVQYILSRQLNTYSFDYSLYDYNVQAQYDLITHNKDGSYIRSTILAAIIKAFVENFTTISQTHSEVIENFKILLCYCEYFPEFSDLYHSFYNTDTFNRALNNVGQRNDNVLKKLLTKQIDSISSSQEVLALDYLFRLAMYNCNLVEHLYICYDNLDAIEDSLDLIGFDDKLAKVRQTIDGFINYINDRNFFKEKAVPHFIILATYRKITASLVGITRKYEEVQNDQPRDYNVHHVDATSAFSYKKIVSQRKKYFDKRLCTCSGMLEEKRRELLHSLDYWESLNNTLAIMEDRYSCLWNKNYRTCSYIANELFSKSDYDFVKCVEFIKAKNPPDGYEQTGLSEDMDKIENVLCTYYGGSAIMLSNVCKVFNNNHIWDDLLDLAKLNPSSISYKNVSLSRLILTYIYNKNSIVSLEELYDQFCSKDLFSYSNLCKNLSKMLARNLDGVWRRPIYYASDYIPYTKAEEIEKELECECKRLHDSQNISHNYSFILCDSGKSYVERLMHEFEFFSNRISNDNECLYLYDSIEKIEEVIDKVFNAVSICCNNMLAFRTKYISCYNISEKDYLNRLFHPTTNNNRPQLHTERTIFSHIAYLNNVRLYFLDERITADMKKRREFNSLFTTYINKYLGLYADEILPICDERKNVYDKLKGIMGFVDLAEKFGRDTEAMFQTISL